jgi:hypothetical protein
MSGMPLSASTMRYHTSQPNRPSHDGYNSFAESMLQQEVTGTVLASPVPDELYRVRLNNFTSDILGAIADGWIGLLAPQPDYQGTNPVWWPASITFMSPRRMLKHGKTTAILSTSEANMAKTESCFSNSCSAGSYWTIPKKPWRQRWKQYHVFTTHLHTGIT